MTNFPEGEAQIKTATLSKCLFGVYFSFKYSGYISVSMLTKYSNLCLCDPRKIDFFKLFKGF